MKLGKVIELAGGQSALAKAIGLKQGHIYYWMKTGRIPGDHVLAVCEAVSFEVTPHELRPDIYPNPTDGLPVDSQAVA